MSTSLADLLLTPTVEETPVHGIVVIVEVAPFSDDPENPTLQPNRKWIG